MSIFTQFRKLLISYRFSPRVVPTLISRMRTGALPNTRQANRAVWGWYDWSSKGEEWSNNAVPGWKDDLVRNLLLPFIGNGHTVLEIGPGAGRWTEFIIPRATNVKLVDLTPECIDICKNRFGDNPNVEFFINDGKSLTDIESESVSRVWSLDVFVHIQSGDIESYIAELSRVMAPGGHGLIHHAKNGTLRKNWRSDMTAEKMVSFLEKHNLQVIDQFESWGEGDQRLWPKLPPEENPDVITTFSKP